MALVGAKKVSTLVASSAEEDDLLQSSFRKIKNGASLVNTEDWPLLGQQGKHHGTPAQSFAEKLQGINSNGKNHEDPSGEHALSDDPISQSESETDDSEPLCNIIEDPARNFPTFCFSEKMKKRLYKAWDKAVIIKLLGRDIGYKLLLSILQSMWVKKGIISLIDVGNGFFVVKFTNKDDCSNALTGGPWMVFDHYLTVRPWEPKFNPWRAKIDKVAVWVRMPKVFLENYDSKALTWIGNPIGDTIKIDLNTSCQLRGHYARICVLVNLEEPLMLGFSLDGEDYYVEYEGLHWLCTNCGVYGHKADSCKTGAKTGVKTAGDEPLAGDCRKEDSDGVTPNSDGKQGDTGVWRVVQKPKRLNRGGKGKPAGNSSHQIRGSRFDP